MISIHAPREGSDARAAPKKTATAGFQSTLPARGATRPWRESCQMPTISIHAPREGSDL